MKEITLFHLFIFEFCDRPHQFLTMPTQKNFHQLLIFVIMYQHAQNQFILFVHSSDTVPSPDWPHLFLTMLTPKIFNHLLICVKLYQHAKNQLITSVFLRYSQFYSPETRLATLIFDHAPPKTFQEPSQASKIEPL